MTSRCFPIAEPTQVGEVRRAIQAFARDNAFDDTVVGKLAIVTTEMGNNLVKHCRGGSIVFRLLASGANKGVEILSLDSGPGMSNIAECLRDGYSTAGTQGTGLGAIKRLSDIFDIYSMLDFGTVVLSQIWNEPLVAAKATDFAVGAISIPIEGESVCGDAWFVVDSVEGTKVIVVDGLGHGPLAAEASEVAVRIFREEKEKSPVQILDSVHRALRSTRGAAVAVAVFNSTQTQVQYAGIGNISGNILSSGMKSQSMVSHNGTAGHVARSMHSFSYDWGEESVLAMFSDGLSARWQIDGYSGLMRKHPSVMAGVLYKEYSRQKDDATVVVLKRWERSL